MVNYSFNLASLIGILLLILGASIVPLGLLIRKPFRVANLVQNVVLAPVYLFCGLILFLQGWRLDPILLFGEFLLILSSFYWVIKDIFFRRF
jgi:hypothetical protein